MTARKAKRKHLRLYLEECEAYLIEDWVQEAYERGEVSSKECCDTYQDINTVFDALERLASN